MQNSKILSCIAIWTFLPCCVSMVAQEIEQAKTPKLPLPQHALWRFGDMDSTESNGFYLIKFSPDGNYLATRNRKNLVEVRTRLDQKLICEIAGHDTRIKSIEFSPDSQFLLTVASSKEPIKIWNVRTGQLQLEIKESVLNARFAASGKSILTLGTFRIAEFSWPDGQLIRRLDKMKLFEKGKNLGLAIERTGRFVVAQSKANNRQFNLTKLIDVRNQTSIILPGPSQTPKQVIFTNDRNWVAAAYPRQEKIRLWNLNNPQDQKFDLQGHTRTVESLTFSEDSRFLVTTGWDKKIIIWDVLTKSKVGVLKGHRERANCADFSLANFQLVSGASGLNDSTVILWDIESQILPGSPDVIENEAEFSRHWNGLGHSNPVTSLGHVNTLLHSTRSSFDWIEKRIGLKTTGSFEQVRRSIEDLQADTFARREAATLKLIELRGSAERILIEALEDAETTELRYRLKKILNHTIQRPKIHIAELRKLHRAIYLLELIASDPNYREPAISLLDGLALNHPHIDVARDASQTAERTRSRFQAQ